MHEGDGRPVAPWQRIAVGGFIVLIGAWYLTTLRSGQPWGDDFAMYVMQARNIAEGHWFAPTGYIYNPHLPKIGPPAYPPLFPAVLAPVYKAWGLNLTPMKVEVVVFFLAALYLTFEFTARYVPFPFAAGIVAGMGLSPYFWDLKESVVSDLPFLFFAMLALVAIAAGERTRWKSAAGAVAAGVCAYLCFAMRTVGVVMLASLFVACVPRRWEIRRKAVLGAAITVVLLGLHSMVFRGASSYLDQLHAPWRELPHNLAAYSWNLRNTFFGVGSGFPGWAFLLVLMAGGAAGMAVRLREHFSPIEAFALSYTVVILLWAGEEDLRLLIPLLPVWFLYVAVALRKYFPRTAGIAGGVLLAAAACGYADRYSTIGAGPIRDGMGDPAFVQVCSYLEEAPPGTTSVFSKPRLLALVTRRPAAAYHHPASDADLWEWMRSIQARYVLVNRDFAEDRDYLEPLLKRNPTGARPVYSQGAFQVYGLR